MSTDYQFELVGIAGEYEGQRLPLTSKPLVLGRDPRKAELVLSETKISRTHCQLYISDGAVCVEDLGSTQGTWLNDRQQLQAYQKTRLRSGDTVSLAGFEVFQIMAVQQPDTVGPLAVPRSSWSPPVMAPSAPVPAGQIRYAGFWKRVAATLIDGVLIGVVFYGLSLVFLFGFGVGIMGAGVGGGILSLIMLIAWWVAAICGPFYYFASLESSERQASYGKRAMGIIVTDMQGRRISFGKALGRNACKILSGMILYIGHLMAAFTDKKQTLHDMITDCLVIEKPSQR